MAKTIGAANPAAQEAGRGGGRSGQPDHPDRRPWPPGSSLPPAVAADHPDERVGSVLLGRYRVLHCRHAGPRSRVYEVEPPGVGQSRRALKLLDVPEAQNPQAHERLSSLAEGLRGLHHPHLEHVFALGRLDDETPFLVTEWLPLPSLAAWLAAEPRPTRARALQLVRGVASALAVLHHRGLAHGDVRPGHVLVESGLGVFERVVLTDAGLADALGAAIPRDLDGWLAGAAPERLTLGNPGRRFERGAPSAAADVYALAVLAWRLLTGVPPFLPEDSRAAVAGPDPAERLIYLHRHHRPVWPCAADGTPWLSPALGTLLGQSLAKDPAERPADADVFLVQLEAAVAWPEASEVTPGTEPAGAPPAALAGLFAGPPAAVGGVVPTQAAQPGPSRPEPEPGAAARQADRAGTRRVEGHQPVPRAADGLGPLDAPSDPAGTAPQAAQAAPKPPLSAPPPTSARPDTPSTLAAMSRAWPWLVAGLAVGAVWAALAS